MSDRKGPKKLSEMNAETLRMMVQLLRLRVAHLERQLARQQHCEELSFFPDESSLQCELKEEL